MRLNVGPYRKIFYFLILETNLIQKSDLYRCSFIKNLEMKRLPWNIRIQLPLKPMSHISREIHRGDLTDRRGEEVMITADMGGCSLKATSQGMLAAGSKNRSTKRKIFPRAARRNGNAHLDFRLLAWQNSTE